MAALLSPGNPLPGRTPSTMLDPMPFQSNRRERCGRGRFLARTAAWRHVPILSLFALGLVLAAPQPARGHEEPDFELGKLDERIREHPDDAAGYLDRAELQRTRREWSAAAADLQTAARLDPELSVIDLSLAGLLLEANNPAPAHEAADRYLAGHPDDASAHLLKARILVRLGSRRAAIDAFDRGIALAGRSGGKGAQPDDFLQRARLQSCEGDPDAALRGIDDGLSQLGDAITLQLLAVDLELARSSWDAALARLARIEAAARRKESWIARRADVLARAGRRDEAARAYAEAEAAIDQLPASLRDKPAARELAASIRDARASLETRTTATVAPALPDWCATLPAQTL